MKARQIHGVGGRFDGWAHTGHGLIVITAPTFAKSGCYLAPRGVFKDFCTPFSGAPKCIGKPQKKAKLYKHMTRVVEMACTDAASDEMLATPLLVRSQITPNCRLTIRDKTHASRRRREGWYGYACVCARILVQALTFAKRRMP